MTDHTTPQAPNTDSAPKTDETVKTPEQKPEEAK